MTPDMLAAYEAAVDRLPPLSRVVFLLHRVDDLSFRQIASRLTITIPAVQCGIAEALSMIAAALDGDTPRRWQCEPLLHAEAELRRRHRRYCERKLRLMGIAGPIAWDEDDDDEQTVLRMIMSAIPRPIREAFVLHEAGELSRAQIACRAETFQWVGWWRMLGVNGYAVLRPRTFGEWLCRMASARFMD